MTGMQMVMMTGQSGPNAYAMTLSDVMSGLHRASVSWNPDGTISPAGNGSTATPPVWHTPPGGSPGSLYWLKLTTLSGTPPTAISLGTPLIMNINRVPIWDRGSAGTTVAQMKAEIFADAAGTPPARSTCVFNVTVTA